MTKILDLIEIQKQLNAAEPYHDECNDIWEKTIYFGTILELTPSGKFYTPFAHSNIEICDTCNEVMDVPCTSDDPCIPGPNYEGSEEYHCEACKDAKWTEQTENKLNSIDAYMHTSEGCGTDIMISQICDEPKKEQMSNEEYANARLFLQSDDEQTP